MPLHSKVFVLSVFLSKICQFLHKIIFPCDLVHEPITGEFGTQAAKLNAVIPCAFVDGTDAGFLPLIAMSVRLNASKADSIGLFGAALTAFAAGCDLFKRDHWGFTFR